MAPFKGALAKLGIRRSRHGTRVVGGSASIGVPRCEGEWGHKGYRGARAHRRYRGGYRRGRGGHSLLSLEIHLGDQGGRARGAEPGKGRPWARCPTDRRCRRANAKKWSPRTHGTEPKASKALRSEERRVGKEGRSRWSPYH